MSGVDKSGSAFFHHERSGAPVALIGVKRESAAICHSGGESNPELPPQLSAASPSSVLPLGFGRQSLGRRRRVMTREPGDLPGHVILPACGARAWGGLPLW